jgi:hypothetical protein
MDWTETLFGQIDKLVSKALSRVISVLAKLRMWRNTPFFVNPCAFPIEHHISLNFTAEKISN